MELSEYEKDALNRFGKSVQEGKWSNEGLVQLIKLSGDYLNLMTIPEYAKVNNMSYPGVRDYRKIETIFGVRFVIGSH